jgi:hypothetical protein
LHCFVPHLHTVTSCVRSGYYIHNTASFRYTPQATFHYIPAVLCLSPLVFSAVAPSHSHRGWLRYHFALNQGTPKAILYFSPAVSRSYLLRFAPYLRSPFASMVAVRLPQHRLFAPRKTIISAIATIIIFCGAGGCLIADSTRNILLQKKNKKKVKLCYGFK